jgi:hypothetical protein
VLSVAFTAVIVRSQNDGPPAPIAKRLSVEELEAKVTPIDRLAKGSVESLATGSLVWSFLGPQPITGEYWSGNANASGSILRVAHFVDERKHEAGEFRDAGC